MSTVESPVPRRASACPVAELKLPLGWFSGSSLFVTGSLGRRVRTHRLGLLLIGTSGSSVSWCGQPGEASPSWLGPATSLLCKVLGPRRAAVRLEVGLEPFTAKKRVGFTP